MAKPFSTFRGMRVAGYSLVELMVVLAILGVLAGMAAPSLIGLFARHRVDALANELIATLHWARAESIRTHQHIVLQAIRVDQCRPDDVVNSQDWSCGWQIYADRNGNRRRDEDEPVIRERQEAQRLSVMHVGSLTGNGNAARDGVIHIQPNGFVTPPAFRLVLRPLEPDPELRNHVTLCVSLGMRIRALSEETSCPQNRMNADERL